MGIIKRHLSNIIKCTHSERMVSFIRYFAKFKKWPDMREPKTLNEKLLWLEFYTDTSRWTELSDKNAVRTYVEDKGLGHLLVRQYGHYHNANDIDFDSLPDKFVIKTNNGYGTVLLIDDKKSIDQNDLKAKLNTWLKEPFGYVTGEPHYTRIRPCIVIEEMLEIDRSISSSLVDYKFWCLNGKVDFCFVCTERNIGEHTAKFAKYSVEDWQKHDEDMSPQYRGSKGVPRPSRLDDMVKYAEILSAEFPLVRVDFYEVNGRVYFGEMTFTSNGGRMAYFTEEELLRMGAKLDISKKKA